MDFHLIETTADATGAHSLPLFMRVLRVYRRNEEGQLRTVDFRPGIIGFVPATPCDRALVICQEVA